MVTNPNGANQKCIKCGESKVIDSFELRSDNNKYRKECKECSKKRKKNWYETNKIETRIRYIAQKYGLSKRDYEMLLDKQESVCAICGKPETSIDGKSKITKSLAIDHDHKTGKVRGLLCWKCNAMIGYAKDDINILKSAIKYLKNNEDQSL